MAVESSEPANGPFPAGRPARPHFLRPLGSYVASRVTRLQRAHLAGEPEAFVLLARLRRTVGKDALMFPGLRKTMLDGMPGVAGVDDRLAADERAAFAAFALYALHQRSRRHGMHQPGQCLGVMARLLRERNWRAGAVQRRFDALLHQDTLSGLVDQLQWLVKRLRRGGLPLDYGMLADELFWLQAGDPTRVHQRWRDDFCRSPTTPS